MGRCLGIVSGGFTLVDQFLCTCVQVTLYCNMAKSTLIVIDLSLSLSLSFSFSLSLLFNMQH